MYFKMERCYNAREMVPLFVEWSTTFQILLSRYYVWLIDLADWRSIWFVSWLIDWIIGWVLNILFFAWIWFVLGWKLLTGDAQRRFVGRTYRQTMRTKISHRHFLSHFFYEKSKKVIPEDLYRIILNHLKQYENCLFSGDCLVYL